MNDYLTIIGASLGIPLFLYSFFGSLLVYRKCGYSYFTGVIMSLFMIVPVTFELLSEGLLYLANSSHDVILLLGGSNKEDYHSRLLEAVIEKDLE